MGKTVVTCGQNPPVTVSRLHSLVQAAAPSEPVSALSFVTPWRLQAGDQPKQASAFGDPRPSGLT